MSTAAVTAGVCAILGRVLHRDAVHPDDDFFRLGGQSLAAVRVVRAVADELGVALPVQAVFAAPTARALARHLLAAPATPADAPGATDGTTAAPLSWQQESMYRMEQAVAGSSTFGSVVRFSLVGRLDLAAFTDAFLGLVRRHEVLRTRYRAGPGGVAQQVLPHAEYELVEHDLTALPPSTRETALEEHVRAFTRRGFDLAHDPGLRLLLAHLADDRVAVVAAVHHINFDGWSRDILLDDFCALYRAAGTARAPEPAAPQIRYADFARWQRTRFDDGAEVARHLRFWEHAVGAGAPRPPVDRPSGGAPFLSMQQSVTIPPDQVRRLVALGADAGTTTFIACLAAFGVVLGHWLGTPRLPVATTTANRVWPSTTTVIGPFSTVVPIAVDLAGEPTFRELLSRCRAAGVEAMRHQEYPFEQACLTGQGDPGRLLAGLRFGIALHPALGPGRPVTGDLRLEQQRVTLLGADEQEVDPSTFDLTLELRESGEAIVGHLAHQVASVSRASAVLLTHRFAEVVRRVTAEPDTRIDRLAPDAADPHPGGAPTG